MANRGLMAENMFIGKSALLNWLNNTLSLKLESIEDTCSGAVACQLMDVLHPGSIKMTKVDFNVRNAYEFEKNYKELQQAFNKVGVDRAFNVNALSKGKRQDNNEFMQWFKGYWDHVTGGQDVAANYDGVARRQNCKTGDWKKFSIGENGVRPALLPSAGNSDSTIAAIRNRSTTNTASTPYRSSAAATTLPGGASRSISSSKTAIKSTLCTGATTTAHPTAKTAQLNNTINDLTEQITELKLQIDTANRERDFYFDKLRDIEILCQAPELADMPILKIVEKVLYAADANEAKMVMVEAQEEYGAELVVADDNAGDFVALGEGDGVNLGEEVEEIAVVAEDIQPIAAVPVDA